MANCELAMTGLSNSDPTGNYITPVPLEDYLLLLFSSFLSFVSALRGGYSSTGLTQEDPITKVSSCFRECGREAYLYFQSDDFS
jgi:hypothetical protein